MIYKITWRTILRKHSYNRLLTTSAILGLIALTPYFSGMLIEKYYRQFTSQSTEASSFKVALKEFKRNFFTSTAIIEIQVSPNNNQNASYTIPIEQKIVHGPFVIDFKAKKMPFSIALAHIHNLLSDPFKTQLTEVFQHDTPITVMTKLGFLGKGTTYFSGVAIKQTTKTNLAIMWDGIEGKLVHSLDLRSLKGEIIAPKLSLTNQDFKLDLTNISSKFNTTQKEHNLAIGNSALFIQELTYQEKEQALLKLANIDISSILENDKANADKLIYSLIANIADSRILQQAFAENVYQLTAKSITPDFFNVLHASYDKKFALFDDLLRQLLNSQANINIVIPKHFTQALIAFCDLQLYKNGIMGKIDPRSNDLISDEIATKTRERFSKLVANKIFVDSEDDQQYKLALEFDKTGKIILNGEQLQNPLQALQIEQPVATTTAPIAVESSAPEATTPAVTVPTKTISDQEIIDNSTDSEEHPDN